MKTISLRVKNMKCMGCSNIVRAHLTNIKGVEEVEAYLDTRTVSIKYNGNEEVLAEINTTLESIGYPVEQ